MGRIFIVTMSHDGAFRIILLMLEVKLVIAYSVTRISHSTSDQSRRL